MRKRCWLIVLIAALFWTGCQNKNAVGDTIILLGKEKYIKPYRDFIPDSLFTKFATMMNIDTTTEGYIPPNIEGAYRISPFEFCYSNAYPAHHQHDVYFKVSDQHNRTAKVELYTHYNVIVDTAYIFGNGQYFTLYFTERRDIHFYGVYQSFTRSVFITGVKEDAGIRNLMFGDIAFDCYTNNPYYYAYYPGWSNIYKDGDGFSENTDFFDNPNEIIDQPDE